jgi:hypothetical protein
MQHIDVYSDEAASFEADVNVLVRNTLHAALAHLSTSATAQITDIEKARAKATGPDAVERLIDAHVDVLATGAAQERFLRNIAVVALSSRVLHSLTKMARVAEHFRPSTHNYKGKSEFLRLWAEYEARFSIDFEAHADKIAFVEPMVRVRNQIVHEGAQANTWNSATLESLQEGQEVALNTTFADTYPQFVAGEGWDAEVVVSQEQLDSMCDASVGLVRWLAEELDVQDQAAST